MAVIVVCALPTVDVPAPPDLYACSLAVVVAVTLTRQVWAHEAFDAVVGAVNTACDALLEIVAAPPLVTSCPSKFWPVSPVQIIRNDPVTTHSPGVSDTEHPPISWGLAVNVSAGLATPVSVVRVIGSAPRLALPVVVGRPTERSSATSDAASP